MAGIGHRHAPGQPSARCQGNGSEILSAQVGHHLHNAYPPAGQSDMQLRLQRRQFINKKNIDNTASDTDDTSPMAVFHKKDIANYRPAKVSVPAAGGRNDGHGEVLRLGS
ncbi:hypothetical protein JCM39068_13680 [Desulfocastanea catecholica]